MMINRDREAVVQLAGALLQAGSADLRGEELQWRLAETFGWNTPSQEANGLRILSMAVLMFSLELRTRAERIERQLPGR